MTRRLWCDTATADYARERLSFPGLRIVLRVDSVVQAAGADPSVETRYFASSLDPHRTTPDQLLALVRGHWAVENSLHFIKDRWWDEDRHYSTQPGVATGFVALTTAALTVLQATRTAGDDRPLRGRADAFNWRIGDAIKLLTEKSL